MLNDVDICWYYLTIFWYMLILFDDMLVYFDMVWWSFDIFWYDFRYVDIFWYYLMIYWYISILFEDILIYIYIYIRKCWCILSYFYILYIIWRGWTRSRSPRGRNLNFRNVFFEKHSFSVLEHSSGLGSITPWSASARRCYHTNSHQNPAYVAPCREKSLVSMVYRRATASGTVPRVPGRPTCIYSYRLYKGWAP